MAANAKQKRSKKGGVTYRDAGVDLEAGDRFTGALQGLVRKTYGPQVIDAPGGFAGLFALKGAGALFDPPLRDPVLVACTDGVGTKVLLAAEAKIFNTVGIDLVAMSVNDLLVCGAAPLFFLDYVAVGKLEQARELGLVEGIAAGCIESGCALLGGETAEMPGVYAKEHFDLAGFAVGLVDRKRMLTKQLVRKGDLIVGLASSGIHSNGYSLVRAVIKKARLKLTSVYPELNADGGQRTLGEVALEPTRIYAKQVREALRPYTKQRMIHAMSHITGGGLPGNLPRILPDGVKAVLKTKSWERPPIFDFLRDKGGVDEREMYDVFNMGLGFCMITAPRAAEATVKRLNAIGQPAWIVGEVKGARAGSAPVVELR
jgi:phosphoribosylformylglycinamidine cyclo-ligase